MLKGVLSWKSKEYKDAMRPMDRFLAGLFGSFSRRSDLLEVHDRVAFQSKFFPYESDCSTARSAVFGFD